jgi:hypothetical protein
MEFGSTTEFKSENVSILTYPAASHLQQKIAPDILTVGL